MSFLPVKLKNISLIESLAIFRLIRQPIRRKLLVLLSFLFLNSIFELAVVSSFYPLLLSLTGDNSFPVPILSTFTFLSSTQSLLFIFVFLLIVSYFVRIFSSYLVFNYSATFTHYLFTSLLDKLYSSSYLTVSSNTGAYYSVIFTTRMQNMQTLFNQLFELIGFILSSLFLFIALLFVDASLTMILIVSLFTIYMAMILIVKKRVAINSQYITGFSDLITTNILNISSNLRSFYVANSTVSFSRIISEYSYDWSKALSQNRFISSFPKLE